MSFTHFEADDRCPHCKALILSGHEIFLFNNSPDAIRLHPEEPEWQPSPEMPAIPMDNGPGRVAYVWGAPSLTGGELPDKNIDQIGEPVVMVHEGSMADVLWVPCSAVTLSCNPGVWFWVCQPAAPKNPASEDWMRSISS